VTTLIKRNPWEIWRDVIFALFIREIRSGFNDKFGIAWAVVTPVIFIFMLSYMRTAIADGDTHSMPVFVFMMYGMTLVKFFQATLNSCAMAFKKNKALFAFRQVQPLSSLVAIALFQLLINITVIFILFIVMYVMSIELRMDTSLNIIANVLQLWFIAVAIGCLFALAESYVAELGKIRELMSMPLLFISGVFFSLKDIPQSYWHYFDWNPILHAIELSRQAAYSSYGAVGVSNSFLFQVTLTSTFLALACYHSFWKQALNS